MPFKSRSSASSSKRVFNVSVLTVCQDPEILNQFICDGEINPPLVGITDFIKAIKVSVEKNDYKRIENWQPDR